MSLNRFFFFTMYKHSGDFSQVHLSILLQVQHENNFLPIPVDTDEAKLVAFLVFVCATASFIAQISYSEMSRSETPSWLR